MTQIAIDKEEAEAVRVKVEAEESKANIKAAATKEIADDAQRVSQYSTLHHHKLLLY
jgi:hypothetical protein